VCEREEERERARARASERERKREREASNSTTVFSGVTFGKCAHAFETANIDGLLANMAPSTYPLCDGKYVGAAEV
jgi:hypothetical protein